ncbi:MULTISPECIES: DUF4124 domain-containing protein [Rheinheimera]|uniref:DUF4124 domain-containing protein n=2 Tax=Gammaproteobacteria TaxID=1236 RepID=A0ABV9JMG7_9GAMM
MRLLLTLLLLSPPLVAQQVYLSYDKDGTPVYSDQPTAGARLVELNVSPPSASAAPANPPADLQLSQAQTQIRLQILEPVAEQNLLSNSGELRVQTRVEPELPTGHQLRLVFDQNQLSPPQRTSGFLLKGIERGEHQLQLQQIDQNGKLIAESPVTRFYLRKSSLFSPN